MDHGALRRLVETHFGASCEAADSIEQACKAVQEKRYDLVLVNRVFEFTGEQGVDLVRQLTKERPEVPVMLVSNFAEAQREAEAAGAVPGFGKGALNDPQTIARLAEHLAKPRNDA